MTLTHDEKKRMIEEEKLCRDMQGRSAVLAVLLSLFIPGSRSIRKLERSVTETEAES